VQCVLIEANLNKTFWEYADYYAIYVMNRICKKRLLWKSSFELLHGKRPTLRHLRVFGCDSYYAVPEQIRCDKLSPRGQRVIHIGFSENRRLWILYDSSKGRIMFSK
jgi:hypothetical protein